MTKVRRAFASRNQRCAPTIAQSLTQKKVLPFWEALFFYLNLECLL